MGNGELWPLQNPNPSTDCQKLSQLITSARRPAMPILVQILRRGLLGKWVKYNVKLFLRTYIYLFFVIIITDGTLFRPFETSAWVERFCANATLQVLALSPPMPLRLYTLPYWSNPPFLIFDIRALWRSGLSARAPECQKIKNGGLDQYGAGASEQQ